MAELWRQAGTGWRLLQLSYRTTHQSKHVSRQPTLEDEVLHT